jgi:hypothetical protein
VGNKLKDVGFSNLDQLGAMEVVKTGIGLMSNILGDIEVIAEYFIRLLEINDNVEDAPGLFTDDFPILNQCLEQAFNGIKSILSWNGLQVECNTKVKQLK